MSCENSDLESKVRELESRLEALERLVSQNLNLTLKVEVPKVFLERQMVDVRISEDELQGRIILLAKEGFFEEGKTVGDVAKELIRRCWHPKDLKHVRPAMEQLTAIGVLNRFQEKRKRGKGPRWVYYPGPLLGSVKF